MRIGILTFHSQTNYGGILQAVSLQNVLRRMGHDVVVINRYMCRDNLMLSYFNIPLSVLGISKLVFRVVLGLGDVSYRIRNFRSLKYIERNLSLTDYGFYDWSAAPRNLGVDLIVVGSDQVWRAIGPGLDPRPYLLIGAPSEIPAIAYAASFGMHEVPADLKDVYARGLRRFSAISTREDEGRRIVESFGLSAVHVVDPTLLNEGYFQAHYRAKKRNRRLLVCYFVFVSVADALPRLNEFCRKNDADVELFTASPYREFPYGKSMAEKIRELTLPLRLLLSRVKFRRTAVPNEFLTAVSNADWVLTDSFHGTMFSTIFRKNFRVLLPSTDLGEKMFSRISEFLQECVKGRAVLTNIADALHSLLHDIRVSYKEDVIHEKKCLSKAWLGSAIRGTCGNEN